ncbi:MAG: 3-deoxy-D-manno-octulosonic acid transferase [Syntrophorhabdaceae bacterium]|nr:3-deoxy-D-manno-octulosonic acid transferase [Syntrophorhabdaceae bacterium]
MPRTFRSGSPEHIAYNLLLFAGVVLLLPLWVPWVLLFRKRRANFFDRLGIYGLPSSSKEQGPVIWTHAVSVGETNASVPLLRRLKEHLPQARLLLSNVTLTGRGTAEKALSGVVDERFYFPFDIPGVCGRFLDRVRPDIVVIVETEIWPNFLAECLQRGIPVVITNGRISERSFRGYSRFRWLFASALRTLSAISTQTRDDADRFVALGADPAIVAVGGNLKFDVSHSAKSALPIVLALEEEKTNGTRWIIAGSTHEGEEAIILRAFMASRKVSPQIKLLLAPRHPERFGLVEIMLRQEDIPFARRTLMRAGQNLIEEPVLLLDTVGELSCAYAAAGLAFVGGSLIPKGGHNILEPAWHGVPTVVGPHMGNFQEIFDTFMEAGGLIRAAGEEELADVFVKFASCPDIFKAVGCKGKELFGRFEGASGRNADTILSVMKRSGEAV